MKTIILMRHGQAQDESSTGTDYDRALTQKGADDSVISARELLSRGLVPKTIICSAAVRTRQTAEAVAKVFSIQPKEIIPLEALYNASASVYLEQLSKYLDEKDTVLLVGHNPTISQVATLLSGKLQSFRTAEYCVITQPIDFWKKHLIEKS